MLQEAHQALIDQSKGCIDWSNVPPSLVAAAPLLTLLPLLLLLPLPKLIATPVAPCSRIVRN